MEIIEKLVETSNKSLEASKELVETRGTPRGTTDNRGEGLDQAGQGRQEGREGAGRTDRGRQDKKGRQADSHYQTATTRQTDRQTDKQTDRQADRQTDSQIDRQTDTRTHRHADTQTDRQGRPGQALPQPTAK